MLLKCDTMTIANRAQFCVVDWIPFISIFCIRIESINNSLCIGFSPNEKKKTAKASNGWALRLSFSLRIEKVIKFGDLPGMAERTPFKNPNKIVYFSTISQTNFGQMLSKKTSILPSVIYHRSSLENAFQKFTKRQHNSGSNNAPQNNNKIIETAEENLKLIK